jgi:hypothetical protein
MKRIALILAIGLPFCTQSSAQVYTNMVVGAKNAAQIDSLKQQEYPYVLPIWGAKAAKMGFQLPYSAGVSVNYFWQESDMVLENLMVGFNGGPMYDLDEIIRFDGAVSSANAVNFRPDIWLFPFLNVYGIFAKAKTSTAIDAGLWIPDGESGWSEKTAFSTKAKFDATSVGFGLTPTFGVGDAWMALDMNTVWTDVSALNKPVFTFVFGPRLGKTLKFKTPERNIALWAGGFRVKFSSSTKGTVKLSEVLPLDDLQVKVDTGLERVDETRTQVDDWWASLTPAEQRNPANVARYNTANRAIQKADDLLTSIDGALSTSSSSTVQYSLEKYPKDMWNVIVGTQFQLNRHWMVRGEYGFLTSRKQVITGLQYRFGL